MDLAHVRLGGAVALLVGLFASFVDASAQTRVCEYAVGDWVEHIGETERALERGDAREAGVQLELIDRDWVCLSEPVPPRPLARYAQLKSLLAYDDMDADEALRWARVAEFAEPGAHWPEWLEAEHPIRSLIEREGAANVATVPDKYAAHPKKGGVFVDGRFVTTVSGPIMVPIFVQVFAADGARLDTLWTDGPHLPAQWSSDEARRASADPPAWWVPSDLAPIVVTRSIVPEPAVVPPTVASAPATSAVNCPAESVTVDVIAGLASEATDGFAATDRPRFTQAIEAMRGAIGCLVEVMEPREAAVLHRLYAYRSFVAADDAATLRSFQVALALDPSYELPEAIAPAGGPLHGLYTRSRQEPPVATVPFGVPPGMTAYVDGVRSTRRPISAPAFVQLQAAQGVYWSAYLTPADPLPEWLPSAKEALLASVGESVVDDFVALRAAQATRQERVAAARATLLTEAERAFTATATAARVGDDAGRRALEGYVAKYDGAVVVVDGLPDDVVVPQVAAARAWLRVYGEEGVEARVAEHAVRVETARTDTRQVASGDWERTEQLIADADYGGQDAVAAFIDRYDAATVVVGDAEERVFVPEVDVAQDWSAIYGLAAEELPDTHDSLKVVLGIVEERETLDRELMRRISDETAALMASASADWRAAMALETSDPGSARSAVDGFVMRYRDAGVVIEEERIPVNVPEVSLAYEWLAAHPEPIDTTAELRPWPPPRRNCAIAAGATAVAGGGLWVASKVLHDASLKTAADLEQPFSKAEAQAVGANTTAALSIASFAAAAGLGVVVIAW